MKNIKDILIEGRTRVNANELIGSVFEVEVNPIGRNFIIKPDDSYYKKYNLDMMKDWEI